MPKPKIRVAGCFVEYGGKFLILHRIEGKPDGNTWGLVAGKVNDKETDEHTIIREIKEETGYNASHDELKFLGDYIYDFPDLYLEFPTYRLALPELIEIRLKTSEHTEYKWVTPEECLAMKDTIRGLDKDLLEWARL